MTNADFLDRVQAKLLEVTPFNPDNTPAFDRVVCQAGRKAWDRLYDAIQAQHSPNLPLTKATPRNRDDAILYIAGVRVVPSCGIDAIDDESVVITVLSPQYTISSRS